MPTISTMLQTSASRDGARVALVSTTGEALDYAHLAGDVAALAAAFRERGIRDGERVGIYLPKHLLACLAPYAAAASGAVFVPVNPAMKAAQVRHVVRDSGMRALVTAPERLPALAEVLADAPDLRHLVLTAPGATTVPAGLALADWPALRAAHADAAQDPGRDDGQPDALAALFYTSGSTGRPKGVMVTQRNLVVGCVAVCEYLHIGPDDRMLAALPFSFDYGFNQLTTALARGACCVLHDYLWPGDLAAALERHAITGLAGVPPLWNQLVAAWGERPPNDHLRYFTNSGGALRGAVLDRLRALFPRAEPFLMYGLTEAFRSTYLPPSLVDERRGSMGKAIPHADILVMKDDGTVAGPGEEGELVHCGPLVSQGYWNAPETTAARFRPVPARPGPDGAPVIGVWSGDIVRLDEDGFLYFQGRRDGLIKTSGYRVSPDEVEEVVMALPGIADACAFAVPDENLGQRILLAVSYAVGAALDERAVLAACQRVLPNYMVPAAVLPCANIPRNLNGKHDRPRLAAEHATAGGTLD